MMSKRFLMVSLAVFFGLCMLGVTGCGLETPKKQYKQGDRYFDQKNYTEAVKWYRKAADRGYAPAQCMLGVCYEGGCGVPADMNQALYWYRKAAAQGEPVAKYRLEELGRR